MLKEKTVQRFRPGAAFSYGYLGRSSQPAERSLAEELARDHGLRLITDWPMLALSVRCFVAQVAPGQDPAKVTERLEADKRVESAQVMQLFHGIGHNDPFYPLQSAARLLRLDELHRVATGKHVSVALIDTGIDLLHPDLKGQVSKAENFVDGTTYVAELHGTAVAGVIVAKADNGIGIVGIAPSASIMSLRACWQNTQDSLGALCDSFTIGKAIQFALAHQANIIHFSLAGPHDRLLERLIDKAADRGIIVVSAVNSDDPLLNFPASHSRVIGVASSRRYPAQGRTLLAPGERVLTTTLNASWAFFSGSSFAAAHVTGITALLLEKSPNLKSVEIVELLSHGRYERSLRDTPVQIDGCFALARVVESNVCSSDIPATIPAVHNRLASPPS